MMGEEKEKEDDLEDVGMEDAIQAFYESCKNGDWKAAAEAYEDMHKLCDEDIGEGGEEDGEEYGKEEKGKGRPLAALLLTKK